ncbi:hypothetical protein [Salinibaculum rarum]|uniref:hypothetical protein n=1 Tax=Salinibaculum rarum TaxID=3058903 RepID=UPI00265F334D|nr:hypothetical protein [Salinibaculum sp. KK48]
MSDCDNSEQKSEDSQWKYSLDALNSDKDVIQTIDFELIRSILIIFSAPLVTPYAITVFIHWRNPTAPPAGPTTLLLPNQIIPYLTPVSAFLIIAYSIIAGVALVSAFRTVSQTYE